MNAKARNKLITSLAALLLVSGTFAFWNSQREPLHKGKPISYWVDQACDDGNGPLARSQTELKQIGTPAIPYLIQRLKTKDTWLRERWRMLLPKLPLALSKRLPRVGDGPTIRANAAGCLASFGLQATSAVPSLCILLEKQNFSDPFCAANALAAIGPDARSAIPALKRALPKSDPFVQTEIAAAIWNIDRETNLVIPLLTRFVTDNKQRSSARGNAAFALGRLGLTNDAVTVALLEGIKDPDRDVQACSAIALWKMDSHQYSQMAAPIVVKAFAEDLDLDMFLMIVAANHLEPGPALPALRELLKSDSPEVRNFAEKALKELDASTNKTATDK